MNPALALRISQLWDEICAMLGKQVVKSVGVASAPRQDNKTHCDVRTAIMCLLNKAPCLNFSMAFAFGIFLVLQSRHIIYEYLLI